MTSQLIDGSGTGVDGNAHEQTGKMLTYLCDALFTQANISISQKLPESEGSSHTLPLVQYSTVFVVLIRKAEVIATF